MLDTVRIRITSRVFLARDVIANKNLFICSEAYGHENYTLNNLLLSLDGYIPKILLKRRYGESQFTLFLDFSVPKVIYNNNLEEVCENDFDAVVRRIVAVLSILNITIDEESIKNADVMFFHPSKNIPLQSYTPSMVITELSKINLTKKMDMNKTNFRNHGQALQLYAKTHELTFYDKISDLNKPSQRAVEHEALRSDKQLYREIKKTDRSLQIFRMEVRLKQKEKMNEVLLRCGFQKNPTFKDIFKNEVSQKILQHYWNHYIEDKNLFLFAVSSKPLEVLKRLSRHHPNLSSSKLLELVGLYMLSRDDDGGIRALRSVFENEIGKKDWNRISRNFDYFREEGFVDHYLGFIQEIQKYLEGFKPFKLKH